MAKVLLVYYFLIFAFAIIITCSATTYTVGDNSGWDISTNLDTWVSDKKFKIGDSLVFQYSSSHSVDEVTRENFDTCNTTNILKSYGKNGNTTVPLTRGGDRYFVCGNKLHCLGGMKLLVHVEDDKAISPALPPKAMVGSNQRTATVPQSPSSNKNIHFSKGAVNFAKDALHLVYIALMATVFGMLQI